MAKLIMMMGLQASGKSTKAKELKEKMNEAVLLSSDSLREEMFGDIQYTGHNLEVFEELHRRAKEALKDGKDVIYDATNINSKRRMGFLRQLPKEIEKELIFMNSDVYSCVWRDSTRGENCVGKEVIDRTYKCLQIPYSHEKWDKITVSCEYKYSQERGNYVKDIFREMTERLFTYEEFISSLARANLVDFERMVELPQDNPFHTFTVERHSYYVYEYIFKYYDKEDKEDLVIASILHDIGKPYCKAYKEGLRHANFYGHDNVGGQIALNLLMKLGYSQERALKIASLVGLHMRMSFVLDMESDRKLEKLVGEETFIKLNYLRQGDIQAK